MPTVIGHALVGAGLLNYARPLVPLAWRKPAPYIAGILAMLPDADVAGFRFGIDYGDHFGHRGFTHSLVFAGLAAVIGIGRLKLVRIDDRAHAPRGGQTAIVALLLAAAAATHPLLDMLTDGGYGCALFAPLRWDRLFFPVTPIPVSPIGISASLVPVMTWEAAFFLPFFLGSLFAQGPRSPYVRALAVGLGLAGTAGAFLFRIYY